MRTLFLLLFFPISFLHGQWSELSTTGIQGDLYGIAEASTLVVAVGDEGIFTSPDQGINWTRISQFSLPIDQTIYNQTKFIEVYGSFSNVVAAGNDTLNNTGVIFASGDGGTTWRLVYQAPATVLINDMDGFTAVGDNGFIVRRTRNSSSGQNWNTWRFVTDRDLYTVQGDYIAGDSVYLEDRAGWEVIDSTQTWDVITSGRTYVYGYLGTEVYSGFFDVPDRSMGYSPPVPLNPTCLAMNGNRVAMGTDNGIFRASSTRVLEYQPSSQGYAVEDLYFGRNISYAVGPDALILRSFDDGGPSIPYVNFYVPDVICKDSSVFVSYLGGTGTTYTWKVDGSIVSNFANNRYTFPTLGAHEIKLIGSNGTYADSITRNVTVVPAPRTNLPVQIGPSLFCKLGSSQVTIQNSQIDINYRLKRVADGTYTAVVRGTGGTISLPTGIMDDSTYMVISANPRFAECETIFPDTLFFLVENPEARFRAVPINAEVNEPVRLFNNSLEADTYTWEFGSTASISNSNQEVPPLLSYSQTGYPSLTMIATLNSGCADTLRDTSVFVYDPNLEDDPCWAENFYGIGAGREEFDRIGAINLAQDGGLLVSGTYMNTIFSSKKGFSEEIQMGSGQFIGKYDRNGIKKWVVPFDDPVDYNIFSPQYPDIHNIMGISEGASGNIYVVGNIQSGGRIGSSDGESKIAHLSPGISILSKTIRGFVAKYDQYGVLLWYRSMKRVFPSQVGIDADENLYFHGGVNKSPGYVRETGDPTIYLPGGDSTVFPVSTGLGSLYGFIASMDSSGQVNWVNTLYRDTNPFGSQSIIYATGIDVSPDGTCTVSGSYSDFGVNLTSQDGNIFHLDNSELGRGTDGYIMQYNSAGIGRWIHRTYTRPRFPQEHDQVNDVVSDANGNIYFTGRVDASHFTEFIIFETGTGIKDSIAGGSMFLASLNSQGNFRWAVSIKDANSSRGLKVSLGPESSIYVSSLFFPSDRSNPLVSFGSTDGVSLGVNGNLTTSAFAKYDTLGKLSWVTSPNGVEWNSLSPSQMEVDSSGRIFYAGTTGNSYASFREPIKELWTATDTIFTYYSDAVIAAIEPGVCIPLSIHVSAYSGGNCPGDSVSLSFTVPENTQNSSSSYGLWISDSSGAFNPGQQIGSLNQATGLDTISGVLPSNLLASNNYTIKVIGDNPLSSSIAYPLDLKVPEVSILGDSVLCPGDTLSLLAMGGNQFDWTPKVAILGDQEQEAFVFPDTNTTYTLSIIDSITGCSNSISKDITVNRVPTPAILYDSLQSILYVDGANSSESFQWFFNGTLITGSDSDTLQALRRGSYQVIKYENSCSSDSSDAFLIYTTSHEDLSLISQVKVFPNPAQNKLTISGEFEKAGALTVYIKDLLGREVLRKSKNIQPGFHESDMNIHPLPNGLFFIVLEFEGSTFSHLFTKESS